MIGQVLGASTEGRFFWFTVAVLLHFAPDFIFQGDKIAFGKRMFNKYMFAHVAVLTLTVSPAFYFCFDWGLNFWLANLIWGGSHLLIDVTKVELTRKFKKLFWQILGTDQILHILVLFLIFWLL